MPSYCKIRESIAQKGITIPGKKIGKIKIFKRDIPDGKIINIRILKRSSGWYAQLTIDSGCVFPVKDNNSSVGIDTGFKHLAILSDGKKIGNKRFYKKKEKRLIQAQKSGNKKLFAKLHEKISNSRKDYNHKVSRSIVENYKNIYITADNLRSQSKKFGKSVMDAGIFELREYIKHKGQSNGRNVVMVDPLYTTMTCGNCWELTGPKGENGLAVRKWKCSSCGEVLDRDINSAKVILAFGAGRALDK